jgi:hypothetical protein
LKGASCEKAGIFASAFQRVAMLQNLPFANLAVLPAGVSAPWSEAGNAAIRFEGDGYSEEWVKEADAMRRNGALRRATEPRQTVEVALARDRDGIPAPVLLADGDDAR